MMVLSLEMLPLICRQNFITGSKGTIRRFKGGMEKNLMINVGPVLLQWSWYRINECIIGCGHRWSTAGQPDGVVGIYAP